MRKIILSACLIAGGVALSVTAYANNWLLYLPAILTGSNGGTTVPPDPPGPAVGGLNDTGITTCAGSSGEEDCDYGRDVTITEPSPSDGHAGFSFTRINDTCVYDNVTGLAWEVKTAANAGNTYDLTSATTYAESFAGCGSTYTSCRLPTIKELVSIVSWGSYSAEKPVYIDPVFFPHTTTVTYLTSTEVANASSTPSTHIWGVDFSLGTSETTLDKTSSSYSARAVCVDSTN
ncbi:MAG: DUF1566 domain-containing protein [Candidatus Electrothrix sp. AUS4]|nr:DUF1566 domain-containing protein [Candidatus Electrothrix sp. AUS4]